MDMQLMNNMDKLEKMFESRMCHYEQKLQKAAAGTSSAPPDISTLSREFTDFKTFVWQTLSTMKTQIELLSMGLDRHETAMRRKVLLLHGVPEMPNEKIHSVVLKVLTDQLKMTDVTLDHLQVCHRLGSSHTKARPILLRFNSIHHRHLVWDNKTALKGSGITMSEFLTKTRHKIFMTARGHFGVKQCWSVEGRIMIILSDKSRRKIESMRELEQLIKQFPHSRGVTEDTQESSSAGHSAFTSDEKVTRRVRRR